MLVFRIAFKKYTQNLSVSGLAGRWNSEGKQFLYTSENISLALLENMVYRMGTGFNRDYKIMVIEIPDSNYTEVKISDLPPDWRKIESYQQLRTIGDEWYDNQKSLGLKVPSSLLPENHNFVINTTHPDFKKVKLIDVLDYEPDDRLEELLKKYRK